MMSAARLLFHRQRKSTQADTCSAVNQRLFGHESSAPSSRRSGHELQHRCLSRSANNEHSIRQRKKRICQKASVIKNSCPKTMAHLIDSSKDHRLSHPTLRFARTGKRLCPPPPELGHLPTGFARIVFMLNFQVIDKTIRALHREGTQRPKIGPSKCNRNGVGSIDATRNRTPEAPA